MCVRSFALSILLAALAVSELHAEPPHIGKMRRVADLSYSPGALVVDDRNERIFVTLHPLRKAPARLAEIVGKNSMVPWPNPHWNGASGDGPNVLVSPTALALDSNGTLFVVDSGLRHGADTHDHPPKVIGFDTVSGEVVFRHDFDPPVARPGDRPAGIALDEKRRTLYITDAGGTSDPGLIVLDMDRQSARRITGHRAFYPGKETTEIGGKPLGILSPSGERKPVRIGVDPIALSAWGEKLFIGPLTGENWYEIPTDLLRSDAPDEEIHQSIRAIGKKPHADAAAIGPTGHHFFTDLENNGIAMLRPDPEEPLLVTSGDHLQWPADLDFGPEGWLYFTVSELHRAPAYHAGEDRGRPPYHIYKVWTLPRNQTTE